MAHTRVSRRDHAFCFSCSSFTCLWAVLLSLLSLTLYLDRALDHGLLQTWRLPQSFVVADISDSTRRPGRRLLRDNTVGMSIAADMKPVVLANSKVPVHVQALAEAAAGARAIVRGALKGMGVTFRKGSRPMKELVVAHLDEATTSAELRLFVRTLHRSGVTARADVVFLFPRGPVDNLTAVLHEEERNFWRLMLGEQYNAPVHKKTQKKKDKKAKHSNSTSPLEIDPASNTVDSVFTMPNSSIDITSFNLPSHDHDQPSIRNRRLKEVIPQESSNAVSLLSNESINSFRMRIPTSGRTKLKEANGSIFEFRTPNESISLSPFNVAAFWQSRLEGIRGQGQGRRFRGVMWETPAEELTTNVEWGDWGSIVGFDMHDLEIDEALAGFIDNPPAHLRRWMCYKMLLGMMRPHYRTVLLTEVTGVLILGDVMSPTRDASFGSKVFLFNEDRTWNQAHRVEKILSIDDKASRGLEKSSKDDDDQLTRDLESTGDQISVEFSEMSPQHGQQINHSPTSQKLDFIQEVYGKKVWQKLVEEDKQKARLGSGFIMGNMKSIHMLSNSMLTEIVRVAAIIRKNRDHFHDQPLLNYLVLKSGILSKKVSEKLVILSNGALFVHILPGSKQKSVFSREERGVFHAIQGLKHELVATETVNIITQSLLRGICSSSLTALTAYKDC